MIKRVIFVFIFLINMKGVADTNKLSSLKSILELAYKNNPELQSIKKGEEAEKNLVNSKYWLEDPMIGISVLNRGTETKYGVLSQRIRFPVKYYLDGQAQESRAKSLSYEVENIKLKIKHQVTTLYYSLFTTQKILSLIVANTEALAEFARVAEKKYAAGQVPQADSMKAHFETTRLELERIRLKQREESLKAELKIELNHPELNAFNYSHLDVSIPKFNLSDLSLSLSKLSLALSHKSPILKSKQFLLEEAQWKKKLAQWEFVPDFQLQYQARLDGQPEDSHIFLVSMSIPLFFGGKLSKASAASAYEQSLSFQVVDRTNKLVAEVNDLKGKVEVGKKSLKIYKTSLIPQAQSSYNSSRSAYRSGKTSFLNLLDSERSLYQVQADYYRLVEQYVRDLSALETKTGFSLSNLGEE